MGLHKHQAIPLYLVQSSHVVTFDTQQKEDPPICQRQQGLEIALAFREDHIGRGIDVLKFIARFGKDCSGIDTAT